MTKVDTGTKRDNKNIQQFSVDQCHPIKYMKFLFVNSCLTMQSTISSYCIIRVAKTVSLCVCVFSHHGAYNRMK